MSSVAVLDGCAKEPGIDELAEQTVVVTQFAPGADFATFRTFAIVESIDVTSEADNGQVVTAPVDPGLSTQTLDAIAAELSARGYRRVTRADGPDLGVSVQGVKRLNAVVPYGAWWGYGAATGGYWGYGGSTLATGITSTGVALWQSGALVIELYDLRAPREAAGGSSAVPVLLPVDPDASAADASGPDASDGGAGGPSGPPLSVVWSAFVYGVLGASTDASLSAPPIDGIRQAFAQSPYLRTP
jgi:hypothetical protein